MTGNGESTNPADIRHRILVADDEALYLRTTGDLLRKAGYDCVCVSDAAQAIQQLQQEHFDLVLSDLNMPGNLKMELLHHHSKLHAPMPIIVVTGVPSLPTAIESIRLGITDYLLKPVKFEDLLSSVRRAISTSKQKQPIQSRPASSHLSGLFPKIIGRSRPMMELFEIIDRVANTDTNILITGESGTGKEVIAKAIHEHSHRRGGMFQVIDCTAVPESLFESLLFGHKKGAFTGAVSDQPGLLKQCDGGTAFFDELGELPFPLQSKLLRAVQEQTFTPVGSHTTVSVDTRFVCATNRDLQMEVNAGRFRQDLFYRLGVIHIDLPPLRDRGDDVLLLANSFLETLTPETSAIEGFTTEAIECLRRYRWPGNIRELRNVIERTIALCHAPMIDSKHLPQHLQHDGSATTNMAAFRPSLVDERPLVKPQPGSPPITRQEAMRQAECQYLSELMEQHGGNVSEAARQAGISRQGLHKLLKTHGIQAADFR